MHLEINASRRQRAATIATRLLVAASLGLGASAGYAQPTQPAAATTTRTPAATPMVFAEGELQVIVEDDARSTRTRHFLKTTKGRYELKIKGKAPHLLSGARVRVKGTQSGTVLSLDSSSSVQTVTPAPLPYTLGEQKTVMLMVNFQDNPVQPYTLADATNVLSQTNTFIQENSLNQTSVSGSAYGWYTLPIATTCDGYLIAQSAKQVAAAAGLNLSAYTHFVYILPRNTTCGWSGQGTVGGTPGDIWINGAPTLKTVGHELGHNFGLYHSHNLECGATTLGSACTQYDYGDTLDIMGNTNAAHFNAFQKERMGWLNNGSMPPVTTVTASGSYALTTYEATSTGAKALKILKSTDATTGARTWYYVEFRQALGADAFLATTSGSNVTTGVVVRTGSDGDINSSVLLDMTPNSTTTYSGDWSDLALVIGQSYTDSTAGVTITPVSVGSSGASVSVTLNTSQTSCVRANPTLTPSTQSLSAAAGTTLSYSLTVTNRDSSSCSASSFNLAATAPTGWGKNFAAPTLTLAPGASATTTLSITSPTTATGSNNIGITASNGSVAGYSANATATYVVGSTAVTSLGVTASTNLPSYTSNQTVSLKASVKAGSTVVAGASVIFTITTPTGATVIQNATTDSSGMATSSYRLSRKASKGVYQVQAKATSQTLSGSGTTSFSVQ